MCMTAIHAQTERKRQDRSARCAEKHRFRARTQRFRGLIRPVSAACATACVPRGKKRLSSGRIQAILATKVTPLEECWSTRQSARHLGNVGWFVRVSIHSAEVRNHSWLSRKALDHLCRQSFGQRCHGQEKVQRPTMRHQNAALNTSFRESNFLFTSKW